MTDLDLVYVKTYDKDVLLYKLSHILFNNIFCMFVM